MIFILNDDFVNGLNGIWLFLYENWFIILYTLILLIFFILYIIKHKKNIKKMRKVYYKAQEYNAIKIIGKFNSKNGEIQMIGNRAIIDKINENKEKLKQYLKEE